MNLPNKLTVLHVCMVPLFVFLILMVILLILDCKF